MLKRVRPAAPVVARARVVIVASEYNRRHVDGLLDAAAQALRAAGADVEVFRVPGAFEIPVAVASLLHGPRRRWSAVICLGVIIRGETAHADLVGTSVTAALMELSVRHRVPVIHEVLLVASEAQADARCLKPGYNRGAEAAQSALAMVRLLSRLPPRLPPRLQPQAQPQGPPRGQPRRRGRNPTEAEA